MEQVLILVESGKIRLLCWKKPRSEACISLHAWQSNSSTVILPQWAKKREGSTSACYLWRFTKVWETLMWLTFIYNMALSGPHVHMYISYINIYIYIQSQRESERETERLIQNLRMHNGVFFFFHKFYVTLVEDFFSSPLSKYLSLCECPQMKAWWAEQCFCPNGVSLPLSLSIVLTLPLSAALSLLKMWTVPRISWAQIYLMHPHRVLLKSILGYGACQALSLVIYACYSLRERVHRPSLCRDHMDHRVIEYENI